MSKLNRILVCIHQKHFRPFPKPEVFWLSHYSYDHRYMRGKHYRLCAGIRYPHIPCEATFTNLKDRLGAERYEQIFHVLVEIIDLLGFLTHKILAIDGTLFPTHARCKGCTYFSPSCPNIEFKGLIDNARRRILYRLSEPERIVPGKEIRIKVECPSPNFPQEIKRPRVQLLVLTLQQANLERPSPLKQLFALKEELAEANLDLVAKRGLLHAINLADEVDSFCFSCPKLPSDLEARIGVRRNPQYPDRKEKIFGFNAVIGTAIELTLGIELPVACITIAGNAQEGNQYIPIKEQIHKYYGKRSNIDVADAKYDELHNYESSRTHGAIPIIDYKPQKRENNRTSPKRTRL